MNDPRRSQVLTISYIFALISASDLPFLWPGRSVQLVISFCLAIEDCSNNVPVETHREPRHGNIERRSCYQVQKW